MNLIALSYMYPKNHHPYLGIFVEEQIEALKDMVGEDITVVSPVPWSPRLLWFRKKWRAYGRTEREAGKEGIKVYYSRYLVIPRIMGLGLEGIFMYLAVRSLVKKLMGVNKKETVLHAHRILPEGFAAILLKKEFGLKIVCTAHGSDINSYPSRSKLAYLLTKYVLEKADALVAVSETLKGKIREIVNRGDIRVVTNGVNLKRIAGNALNDDDVKDRNMTILFVGNICPEKGVRELLQAFHTLRRKYPFLRLLLLGNNTMPKWIRTFITANQMEDSVEITGAVDHREIGNYYSRATIFVLPSYSEGMPTVMFEAMANRLPIIISRVGGVDEVVRDGINGILVEPRSVNDLCQKLGSLIENDDLRAKLAENAFEDAVSHYTWNRSAREMYEIYQGLLHI